MDVTHRHQRLLVPYQEHPLQHPIERLYYHHCPPHLVISESNVEGNERIPIDAKFAH
jgi:hypothetical protein